MPFPSYDAFSAVKNSNATFFSGRRKYIVVVPHLATYSFLFIVILNQNWVLKIDSGMALPHFHLVYWMRFEPTTLRSRVEFASH